MEKSRRTKLVLIPGGCGVTGPIDRLGLRERYPLTPPKMVWILVGTKIVLLSVLVYLMFG